MKYLNSSHIYSLLLSLLSLIATGCHTVDDSRIPALPVYIDLSNMGLWSAYGVNGFGDFDYFVFQSGSPFEPSGFPYTARSATGFGGVLLIEGMDPFSQETGTPLAYDLSCPVERSQNIRVAIDPSTFEAVCPVCDSHYNVTTGAGAPTAGPALTGKYKYGLRRYYSHHTVLGGYIITDTQ